MRALFSNQGNAMIIALLAIALVGGMSAVTWERASNSEGRAMESKNRTRAEISADSALQMAVSKIQRVGSSTADESSCSRLDGPRAYNATCATTATRTNVNSVDGSDGAFNWTVRGTGAKRTIKATGYYDKHTESRQLTFAITPRVFRYALFSDGANSTVGMNLSTDTRLYIPPAYKTAKDARGGDFGSNRNIDLASGTRINNRAADPVLYDSFFLPRGATANTDFNQYYINDPNSRRGRWGAVTLSPNDRDAGAGGSDDVYQVRVSGSNVTSFPHNSGQINFDGRSDSRGIKRMATTTAFPTYSGMINTYETTAQANAQTNPNQGQTGAFYTPTQFNAAVASGNVVFRGLVMVSQPFDRGVTCELNVNAASVLIEDGGLVVHGCNLNISASTSFRVRHAMHDSDDPSHQLPAIMTLRNTEERGGNLVINSNNANQTSTQGVVYTEGDLTVSTPAANTNASGNFVSRGAVVVGGRFITTGSPAVVLRWSPLAQSMSFDTSEGRMGTYAIKTFDKPPPSVPSITFTATPSDPHPALDATFTWDIEGDADKVECRFNGSSWAACDSPRSYSSLVMYSDNVFDVRACNVAKGSGDADSDGNKHRGCDVAVHRWRANPPVAAITMTGQPAASTYNHDAAFTWTVSGVSGGPGTDAQYGATGIQCRIDNGTWTTCASGQSYGSANGSTSHPGTLSHGSHTFDLRVCNVSGCDTETRTWTVNLLPAPSVTITSAPANPSAYTANSPSFSWTTSSSPASVWTTQCQIDGGTWTTCTSPRSYSNLTTNSNHTFSVRVTNEGGTNSDTRTWFINPTPPAVSFTSTPANPSASTSRTGTFQWSVSNGMPVTSYDCRIDSGSWGSCSSGHTTGTLSNNCGYWGCSHTFETRGCNGSGCGSPASYSWSIYPDAPTVSWTSIPGNVGYGSDSSTGSVTSGGGPHNLECYAATGWVSCSSTHAFAAGGWCSDTTVQVRAVNATGTASTSSQVFHRDCDPASASVYWNAGQAANTQNVALTQGVGARSHPNGCTVYRDNGDLNWSGTTWCPSPVNFWAAGVCLQATLSARAWDNSSFASSQTGWRCRT